MMHLPAKDASYLKRVEDIATRNRAYRRTRPVSGEKIDDVEWSLSQLEGNAAPALQALVEKPEWPLRKEEKLKIASLLAMQTLRGADGQEWLQKLGRKLHVEMGLERPLDTDKFTMVLKLSLSVAAVFGSMQWLLIEFDEPLLATSDEPVVIWPADVTARNPADIAPGFELQPLLEVRTPVSPSLAIVMTWVCDGDERFRGDRDLAANLNALTIGQADRQWFHLPGVDDIPIAVGALRPVSPHLLPGYGRLVVEHSRLRKAAMAAALETLDRPLAPGYDNEITVVSAEERRSEA